MLISIWCVLVCRMLELMVMICSKFGLMLKSMLLIFYYTSLRINFPMLLLRFIWELSCCNSLVWYCLISKYIWHHLLISGHWYRWTSNSCWWRRKKGQAQLDCWRVCFSFLVVVVACFQTFIKLVLMTTTEIQTRTQSSNQPYYVYQMG